MERFVNFTGKCVAIYRANIDTDQIIPKQFLKSTERSGFGRYLFYDWRYNADGSQNSEFILNRPNYSDSTILLTGTNFGCGSSREHAPWSILDYGFRVIIAPGFADIFYNNCLKIGLLPIVLPENTVAGLAKKASGSDGLFLSVDLASQIITGQNFLEHFEIDPFRKDCLLKGLDEIGLTLEKEADIQRFEAARTSRFPFLNYPLA